MITPCRANSDPRIVADKLARVNSGLVSTVNAFVEQLRSQRPDYFVPYVDPDCGGVNARILILLQDPGRRASAGGSGMLSISNDDPTAATFWHLLSKAGIPWSDVMIWNAVPWYTGGDNTTYDLESGRLTFEPLTDLIYRLQVIITCGDVATRSWRQAVARSAALRRFKLVHTLHPSIRGLTRGSRQPMDVGKAQMLADLVRAKSLLDTHPL